jgi:murein DD-endopeptidase MepM/ murein hydrolase activator NlpD
MTSVGGFWIGVGGFLLGAASTALVVSSPAPKGAIVIPGTPAPVTARRSESIAAAPAPRECSDVDRDVLRANIRKPPTEDDAIAYQRHRRLQIPVAGVAAKDLRSSFTERRGGSRTHEAMDILAPRNTPVHAVDDGCVAKLFESKAGGITLYQFDSTLTYTYYYAHLERYADDIDEGDPVRRGEVLGYVGTSGNAPPGTPHLHFAIFILGVEKHWWEGTPIDPFDVWRAEPTAAPFN